METLMDLIISARKAGEMAALADVTQDKAKIEDNLEQLFILCEQPKASDRIQETSNIHYRGAVPFEKLVDKKMKSTEIPLACIGIDGSQVYPEPYNPVLLGWVTALAYQMGPGVVFSLAKSVTKELGDLDEETQKDFVDLARSVLEITIAQNIITDPSNKQKVILLDGGVLPWVTSSNHSRQYLKELLSQYYVELKLCHPGCLAAVIQNPRSRALINLLRLLQAKNIEDYEPSHSGLHDRDLMLHFLKPGERTAVFQNGLPVKNLGENEDLHTYFFYTRSIMEILRIEIPEWIAHDQILLNQVHASIIHDSQLLGMPYTLAQAHQHVVVKLDMVEAIKNEAYAAYFNAGGHPNFESIKGLIKRQ